MIKEYIYAFFINKVSFLQGAESHIGETSHVKHILELSGHMKITDGARTVGGSRWGKAEGEKEEEGTNMGNPAGSRSKCKPAGDNRDKELDEISETTEFQSDKIKILRCSKLKYSGTESERKSS